MKDKKITVKDLEHYMRVSFSHGKRYGGGSYLDRISFERLLKEVINSYKQKEEEIPG